MLKKTMMFSLVCCMMLCANDSSAKQSQENPSDEKKVLAHEERSNKIDESFYNKNGFVIGVFGGGGIIQAKTEYEAIVGDLDIYDRQKIEFGPTYGIKLGYDVYFLPSHGMRIYAEYIGANFLSNNNIVGKTNMHTIAINAEYKFEITKRFGVFAGINANYTFYQTTFGQDGGFGVGVNAGLTYALTSWMELEFGVKYLGESFREKLHTPDSLKPILPTGIPITHQKTNIDIPINFRLGINFKI